MAVPVSSRALITLDEYKRYKDPSLLPEEQSRSLDDHFQSLINGAGAFIRRYCDLPLLYEDFADEYHDGDGNRSTIRLYNYPIVTGAGIPFIVTEDRGLAPVTLTLGTDFKVRRDTGELVRVSGTQEWLWAVGIQNIDATYRAGRWVDTASVDWDMKVWVLETVDWLHTMGPATYGQSLTAVGVVSVDAIPKPIKLGLQRYKRQPEV